jgi:hypothetical protein
VKTFRYTQFFRQGGFRSSGEHSIPECGRSVVFEWETTEGELPFVNTTKQFHSGYGDGSKGEAPEPEHGVGSGLDTAMILFDQVVQILRRAQPRATWEQTIVPHIAYRAMGGGRSE